VTTNAQADDFDIGKAIFDQLKDLSVERQQRVLRWVAEGLGVPLGTMVAQQSQASGSQISPQMPPATAPPGETGMDIKRFIAAKAPKSDKQFAAAVVYFYRFEAPPAERRDSINGAVLQEAARLAGRKRLQNPRATLNNTKAAGYLDSTARGEFTINSVGENLVAMTLPGGGDATTRQAGKKKPRKKGSKGGAIAKKR
jgi:hypothetical protein